MLIKFLHYSSLKRKKKEKCISQYQHSARTGHFVMLDLIRWTTMATAKKKSTKILLKDHANGRRERRKQPTGEPEIKWTDTPGLQKSHFLNPIIVYKNISSVQLKQNDADRVNSACIGWEKPARGVLQSSVFRDAILGCSSPPLSHPARGWTSRGLAGVCLHTSINITKIMLVHRPFEEILPIVAAVMIAWWHFLSQIH